MMDRIHSRNQEGLAAAMPASMRWRAGLVCLLATWMGAATPGAIAQVYAARVGDIFAANYRGAGNVVVRVDPTSGFQRKIAEFAFPTAVAISPEGSLYVTEWDGAIKNLNLRNGQTTVINPNRTVSQIWGIALAPGGDLFVSDGALNRIVRIDPNRGSETVVVEGGNLSLLVGVASLDLDRLVVASKLNSQVVSILLADATQTVLAGGAQGIDQPWGIAVHGDRIYVGAHDSKVLQYLSGTSITTLTTLSGFPLGLATGPDGQIVVAVTGGVSGPYGLERLSSQGELLGSYSGGWIGEITGLAVSPVDVLAEAQTNSPPTIDPIPDLEGTEDRLITFAARASDSDWPLQRVSFKLIGTVPAGASVSSSGFFSWRPGETQAPSTNVITLLAEDDGSPANSSTQTVQIVVQEVNRPPVLMPIPPKTAAAGSVLTFQLVANDPDLPAQALHFSLGTNAPSGAVVSPAGDFTWSVGVEEAPGKREIEVTVTDDGEPTLTASGKVQVEVTAPLSPQIQLLWSGSALGPFAVDAEASVDDTTRTITAAKRETTCFYQILSRTPARFIEISVTNGNVVLKY